MGCKDEFQISSAVKREKCVFTAEFEDAPLILLHMVGFSGMI